MMRFDRHKFIQLRRQAGYNQNQTARLLNVSRELIRQYETGQTVPGCRMLGRLCDMFGVAPNYFFNSEPACQRQQRQAKPTEAQWG